MTKQKYAEIHAQIAEIDRRIREETKKGSDERKALILERRKLAKKGTAVKVPRPRKKKKFIARLSNAELIESESWQRRGGKIIPMGDMNVVHLQSALDHIRSQLTNPERRKSAEELYKLQALLSKYLLNRVRELEIISETMDDEVLYG